MKRLSELTLGETQEIIRDMRQQTYFYEASLEVLAKHFLSRCILDGVFAMSFADLRQAYVESLGTPVLVDEHVPEQEAKFYSFVCRMHLRLAEAPSGCLLSRYNRAVAAISELDSNMDELRQQANKLVHKKAEQGGLDETDRSEIALIHHMIEKSSNQKDKLVTYMKNEIRDDAYWDAQVKDGVMHSLASLFNTTSPLNYFESISWTFKKESVTIWRHKLWNMGVQDYQRMMRLYEDDRAAFKAELKRYMASENIMQDLKGYISSHHRLVSRADILLQALEAYDKKQSSLFCNVIPLQIEGVFYDYGLELGISDRELHFSSLSDKLEKIKQKLKGDFYHYEYFAFPFQGMRNRVAHGKIMQADDLDLLADLLLLDMYTVARLLATDSLPVNELVGHMRTLETRYRLPSLMACLLLQEKGVEAPAFYQLEPVEAKIQQMLKSEPFWQDVQRLTAIAEKGRLYDLELGKGLKKIILLLKKSGVRTNDCTAILRMLGGFEPIMEEEEGSFLRSVEFHEHEVDHEQWSV